MALIADELSDERQVVGRISAQLAHHDVVAEWAKSMILEGFEVAVVVPRDDSGRQEGLILGEAF